MALFEPAFAFVMSHEDPGMTGKVFPEPKGARMRFGINSLKHPEAVQAGLFNRMDEQQAFAYAVDFYKYKFFQAIFGYQIKDQKVANKYTDLAVNMGIQQATKLIQRAVNRVIKTPIEVDGIQGNATLNAVNECDGGWLVQVICDQAEKFYRELVHEKPELAEYLNGWLTRADARS